MSAAILSCFCLSALLLALAAHPFVTYPLSLALLRRKRPAEVAQAPAAALRVAVCVAAYNEEAVIEAKIRNLLAMRAAAGDLDILVYVDGAGDRTAALLAPYADQIRLIVSPVRRGKSFGMNSLVAETTADIVLFTDANVMVDPDAVAALRRAFADPSVGCVCGHLHYVNDKESVTAESGSLYWKLEERIKQLESETGSLIGADGSIFAIRRSLHRAVPEDIIDDFYLSLCVLCEGYRVIRDPGARAYEKSVTLPREEYRRKIRIACQAANVHRLMAPRLQALDLLTQYKYFSHKMLRWMTAFFLAEAALAALAGLALAIGPLPALLVTATLILIAAAAWRAKVRAVTLLFDILAAFVATAIGVLKSYRGERFQTWTPATSVRRAP